MNELIKKLKEAARVKRAAYRLKTKDTDLCDKLCKR